MDFYIALNKDSGRELKAAWDRTVSGLPPDDIFEDVLDQTGHVSLRSGKADANQSGGYPVLVAHFKSQTAGAQFFASVISDCVNPFAAKNIHLLASRP